VITEGERNIEERVLTALRRVARATSLYSNHIQQEYGLTVPQLLVLREVEEKGAVSGTDLADAVNLSQPTVTGIVNRLEKRELVVRTRSMDDKRMIFISVTVPGKDLLRDAPPPMQSQFVNEFRRLEEWEQLMILASLERVVGMTRTQELGEAADSLDLAAAETDPSETAGLEAV